MRWGLEFEKFEAWQIWDENGPVDRGDLRNPRDGERFVILIQEIEEGGRVKDEEKIEKFIAETKWRRLKSKFKMETIHIEESVDDSRGEFVSVEEAIRRKHARYRIGFE
jgi:hypothetical protein